MDETVSYLLKRASMHRQEHPKRKGHHAAGVVYQGKLLRWTVSVNHGKEHAEARALSTFLTVTSNWYLKGGCGSSKSNRQTFATNTHSTWNEQAMSFLCNLTTGIQPLCATRHLQHTRW